MTAKTRAVGYCTALLLAMTQASVYRAATAAEVIFTIDPGLSSQDWGGVTTFWGSFVPQSPGSLSAPVSGHFLASFDPSLSVPPTLELIGGHGYWQPATSHLGLPGPGASATPTAANFAGRTAGNEINFAVRNLVYDFSSPAMAGSGGVFSAGSTAFLVSSGGMEFTSPLGSGFNDWVGESDTMNGGTWSLSESSPGSGDWQLQFSSSYSFPIAEGSLPESDVWTTTVIAVANAQFGAANVDTVAPGATSADALGGSSTTGGVSATFSQPITGGGTLIVQQIPNETGLSQAALAAAEVDPIFALSTDTLSLSPQIWNVDFDGDLAGASVELVFAYDDSLLPMGIDESTLGIWHFNSGTNTWDFGGTVDPFANTVTYVADNFSPFQLGVAIVPEPSAAALLASACGGLWLFSRRSRRSKT